MDNKAFNSLSMAYAFKKIALSFDRDDKGFLFGDDIDTLVSTLDICGRRLAEETREDSCDPTMTWVFRDGSRFYVGNPCQMVYPASFDATDKE